MPFFQFFFVTSEYVEIVDDVEVRGVSGDDTVVATGVVDSNVVSDVSTGTVFGILVVIVVVVVDVVGVVVVVVVVVVVTGIFFGCVETADFLGILPENFLKNFFFGFFALFFFPAVELLSLFFVQVVVD